MRIFGVFDKYFLFVIIIISFMAIIVDAKEYKKHGEIGSSKLIKIISLFLLILGIILYLIGFFVGVI